MMFSKFEDMIGKKYGRLTVLEFLGKEKKVPKMKCQCECGTIKIVNGYFLLSGATKSCGCLARDNAKSLAKDYLTVHGDSTMSNRKRLYNIWAAMKTRCLNKNVQHYKDYGGRGIKICDEWMEYEPFKEWAYANGYNDSLTIDRICVNGNYEPSNCRWIPKGDQNKNQRKTLYITYHEETKPLCEWAKSLGVNYHSLYNRIKYRGFSVEEAFEKPFGRSKRGGEFV